MKTRTAIISMGLFLVTSCASSQADVESADEASAPTEQAPTGTPETGDSAPSKTETGQTEMAEVDALEVEIESKSGSALFGIAELREVEDGVRIVVRVDQAEPGLHGVHIHETADCSAEDASSAGGHFNPDGHPHGLPPKDARHLGDLGNIGTTAPDGKGLLEIVVRGANLDENDPHSFLDRALIVHANEDKGVQPTGDSGKRVGCAEVTLAANRL